MLTYLCVYIYLRTHRDKLIQIRMNGLDETIHEYAQRKEDRKTLSVTDTHTHTLDDQELL